MPADVKRSVGSSSGTSGAMGRCGCPRSMKKSRKSFRRSLLEVAFTWIESLPGFVRGRDQIPHQAPVESAPHERAHHPLPRARIYLAGPRAARDLRERGPRAPFFLIELALDQIRVLAQELIQLLEQERRHAAPLERRGEEPQTLRLPRQLGVQVRAHERAVVQKRDAAKALE